MCDTSAELLPVKIFNENHVFTFLRIPIIILNSITITKILTRTYLNVAEKYFNVNTFDAFEWI